MSVLGCCWFLQQWNFPTNRLSTSYPRGSGVAAIAGGRVVWHDGRLESGRSPMKMWILEGGGWHGRGSTGQRAKKRRVEPNPSEAAA